MGCKLSISVVHPSKSPLCQRKKPLHIPKSPILLNNAGSSEDENDSRESPDSEPENIFSSKFKT